MVESVMEQAAHSGNLGLVQWLRAEGCPWDNWTCFTAIRSGRVEVLRWGRENGCRGTAGSGPRQRGGGGEKLGYTDDLGVDDNGARSFLGKM